MIETANNGAINSTSAPEVKDLPDLTLPYELSAAQKGEFKEKGHVLLDEVCTSYEIAKFRPVLVSAAEKFNSETRPLEERDTYGKAFLQITNLWRRDPAVARFTLGKRFAKIAADLMGVDRVRIYHDQALFKEPGGGPTPWHQDQYYWPLDGPQTVTFWMPLVDIHASMTFGSGSNKYGYVLEKPISDESDQLLEDFIKDNDIPLTSYGAMKAGDATFHAGWTLHSAPNNPTPLMREVMTIIYFADGMRVADPGSNPSRADDLNAWLPGLKPGDLASSDLNPVV
jgi:ectoine hydroxylase-related dioxygenase (phytanoyl-CoA dioxygenase family)